MTVDDEGGTVCRGKMKRLDGRPFAPGLNAFDAKRRAQ